MDRLAPDNTFISKFSYDFDHETGILFKYYYGAITIGDISASWDFAIENQLIPPEKRGFILDYRQARMNIGTSEYEEIPKYYRRHPEIFRGYRIAILTENPKDIVIPMLVREKDEGYESRPFATLEAAIVWVLE